MIGRGSLDGRVMDAFPLIEVRPHDDAVLLLEVDPEVVLELEGLEAVPLIALVGAEVELKSEWSARAECGLTWHLKWVVKLETLLFSLRQS